MTCALVLSCALVIAYVSFGSYTRKEVVVGHLSSSKGLIEIYPSRLGIMHEIYVDAGSRVKSGNELLAVFVTPDATSNQSNSEKLTSSLVEQIKILQDRKFAINSRKNQIHSQYNKQLENLYKQIEQSNRHLNLQKEHVNILKGRLDSVSKLFEKNLISRENKEKVEEFHLSEMKSIEVIRSTKLDFISRVSDIKSEILLLDENLKVDISRVDTEIEQAKQRLENINFETEYQISSPVDGVVVSLHEYNGQRVEMDKPILSILPEGSKIEAELLIPSSAVGFVKEGQQVKIRYHSFPHERFGSHKGVLKSISKTLLRPDQVDVPIPINTSVYRARVELPEGKISAFGETYPLQIGMSLEASIFLEERPLYEWIISPIKRLKGAI